MASPIHLSLLALKISGVYNPFSSRFPFPVTFHRYNGYKLNSLHNIRTTLFQSGNHARAQELALIRIKLINIFLHYK